MSTRYEGADAANTSTHHLAPRSVIGEVLLGPDEHALILGYDEVFYVTGTLDELRAFHARIGAALDREGVHECDADEPCAVCDPRDCQACGMSSAECDALWDTRTELCCEVCTVGDTSVMHDPETDPICGAIYVGPEGSDGESYRAVCYREPAHPGEHDDGEPDVDATPTGDDIYRAVLAARAAGPCPACGDPEGPCEIAPCGDPGCDARDCESHDTCERATN